MKRIRTLVVALSAVVALSGCAIFEKNMQGKIGDALEGVVAQLTRLNLDELGTDSSDAFDKVTQVLEKKEDGKPAQQEISKMLGKPDLPPLDKAFITYQLARCQMFSGKLSDADTNFKTAISLSEGLTPSESPQMLEGVYHSYSVCLDKEGKTDESVKYNAKYEALSNTNEKKDYGALQKQEEETR
jgi:hypothetical protein